MLFWVEHISAFMRRRIARVWTWRAILRCQHTSTVNTRWRVSVSLCGYGRRDWERQLLLHSE